MLIVREPRPGIAWSRQRLVRRATYADWMASRAWFDLRRRWYDTWTSTHGEPPRCSACGEPWTLAHGDLHHRTYDRLGHERFSDLVALCRPCHTRLHRIMESSPAWRRLGRRRATDGALGLLRHHARERRP